MDHLPLPRNPVLGSLDIPYLCKEPYDDGPFLTYPARTGWNVAVWQWPESLSRHGREISDEAEIGSFIQTWLYFGLLETITGKAVDYAAFRVPGRTRRAPRFTSKHLTDIVADWSVEAMTMTFEEYEDPRDRLRQDAEIVGDPVNTWFLECQDILDAALGISERIIKAYENRSSTVLKLVFLSIFALGDYLSAAVSNVGRERDVHNDARSTIRAWTPPESVYQPLLSKLHGWCPNRLHGLLNVQICSIGVLWYIANLEPPKVHDSHRTCTPEQCNSLHVDQQDYRTQHVSTDCHCALVGPSMNDMVDVVRRGSIALFKAQHDAAGFQVTVHDESGAGQYVAISHVWADGRGNLDANSLPACILEGLQKDVDALGLSTSPAAHTPIWMDTICLPRYPLDLRRKAVLRLNDVFVKASGVLVQDSYIRALDASNMLSIEVLARISISGWTSRLWTFSEGRLAKRIWFQFRDKAIDLYDLMDRWTEELMEHIPSYPLTEVSYGVTILYSATNLLGSNHEDEPPLELGDIKRALDLRQTSWPSDEALCLGTMLGLDLSKIVAADDSKKMAAFWRQVEAVSIMLIFVKCSLRLEDTGYRWAPATLLGGSNPQLGMLSLKVGMNARPTENGLKFTIDMAAPVCALVSLSESVRESASSKCNFINLCRLPNESPASGEFLLKDKHGKWYSCLPVDLWHPTPLNPDYEHDLPVIFLLIGPRSSNMREHEDQLEWRRHPAVFATYTLSTDDTLLARAHTHLTFFEIPEERWKRIDELVQYSVAFAKQCPQDMLESDEDEMLDSITAWLQRTHTEEALTDLATSVVIPGLIDADAEWGVTVCARYICYFCLVGEWYKVKIVDVFGESTWSID